MSFYVLIIGLIGDIMIKDCEVNTLVSNSNDQTIVLSEILEELVLIKYTLAVLVGVNFIIGLILVW